MKRKLVVLALLLALVSVLFAAGPVKRPKIGAIGPTLDAQFWNNYVQFMKTGANELGVDLVVLNCDNKADLLPKYIEDLVAMKVDGMIVVPYWAGDKKALRDTKAANIPLIFADSYSVVDPQGPQYPQYIAFVGPTDKQAGYQMAKKLLDTMKPNADGKKVIGWVEGTPGTSVATEGCLSLPGISGEIVRATKLRLSFQDRAGRKHTIELEDFFARVIQHEMDHLAGKLLIDHFQGREREKLLTQYESAKAAKSASKL